MIRPEIGLNIPLLAYRVEEERQEAGSEALPRLRRRGLLARMSSRLRQGLLILRQSREQKGPRPPSLIL